MKNPLLTEDQLPHFSFIRLEHLKPAIDQLISDNRVQIQAIAQQEEPSFETLVQPIQSLEDRLERAWSVVSHLNAVQNSSELREIYNGCLAQLTEYGTEVSQNQQLHAAYRKLADSEQYVRLDQAQRKAIDNTLRDFELSGVALAAEKKERFAKLSGELAELSSRFSDNVLDATQAWSKQITDQSELAGMPETALAGARQAAQQREMEGWLLTLDAPSFLPVMTFCENRELRKEVYEAFVTRASELGPFAGKWDNTAIMTDILRRRHEQSQLVGFDNYAERSLARKMARTPEEVLSFLRELAEKSRPVAEKELEELRTFARDECGADSLEAWDLGFYGEKLRQHRYQISDEMLRPYFPANRVIPGLFEVAQRLFGVRISAIDDAQVWHKDVTVYEISRDGEPLAWFYLDPYARKGKRGGAWMADCRVRYRNLRGHLQKPVAFLTCNFTPPVGDRPALLTHDEVTTLFHEFGHGLHHMLTQVEVFDVSGINGVAWDAVELPSQFMENWCWHAESIALISGHHETGEPLPQEYLERMLAARNFQSGMQMLRQIEFSLFDFRLHAEFDPDNPVSPLALLETVREEVAVVRPPAFNRFPNSFSHIFAGGYAAGYYSYKWAEVLAADAFSLFEEKGIFSPEAGQAFREHILEKGGSQEPMELFVAFRGREPQVDALLAQWGIQPQPAVA